MSEPLSDGLTLQAVQTMILQLYGSKDAARGDTATFLWFTEEVGELAAALRSGTKNELASEMADVLAWLATLANVRGVDLASAFRAKYGNGCSRCHEIPCRCDPSNKP